MTAMKERWMLIGTFTLAVLVMFCFAMPNYKTATFNTGEANRLEDRINKLEKRQVEVQQMRESYETLASQVQAECKRVPKTPNTAQIVQTLSLDVDGLHVVDQSFVAGANSVKSNETEDSFFLQPLAITMEADFDSIFSVIQQAESMNRLIRISSIRISRPEREANRSTVMLEAAVGLHAPFNYLEAQ